MRAAIPVTVLCASCAGVALTSESRARINQVVVADAGPARPIWSAGGSVFDSSGPYQQKLSRTPDPARYLRDAVLEELSATGWTFSNVEPRDPDGARPDSARPDPQACAASPDATLMWVYAHMDLVDRQDPELEKSEGIDIVTRADLALVDCATKETVFRHAVELSDDGFLQDPAIVFTAPDAREQFLELPDEQLAAALTSRLQSIAKELAGAVTE